VISDLEQAVLESVSIACSADARYCYGKGACPSVRLSVTHLYCVKVTQARITESSQQAPRRTLFSRYVKISPQIQKGHLDRCR